MKQYIAYFAGFENHVRCSVYRSADMTLFLGRRLIGNNFWNLYFRKIIRFLFSDFFYWKYTIKISLFIWICIWKTWWNNIILPILQDLKIMSGVQYTALITWHDFGMSLNWQWLLKLIFLENYQIFVFRFFLMENTI